eukprot:gene21168-biopygen7183
MCGLVGSFSGIGLEFEASLTRGLEVAWRNFDSCLLWLRKAFIDIKVPKSDLHPFTVAVLPIAVQAAELLVIGALPGQAKGADLILMESDYSSMKLFQPK